jgi:HNH endonuclease
MMKRYVPCTLPDGRVDILTVYTPGDNICVNHLDGDLANNDFDNLQFVDMRENRRRPA